MRVVLVVFAVTLLVCAVIPRIHIDARYDLDESAASCMCNDVYCMPVDAPCMRGDLLVCTLCSSYVRVGSLYAR